MSLICLTKKYLSESNLDSDIYKTVAAASDEVLFKEKNSKFYGYVFPLSNDSEVKDIIDGLRKKHPGAGHFCYAWKIGTSSAQHRTNDDGEPANTAGMPIYGQIQSFAVTNVLIVVVRFFGGTKLGVGGLIAAYRTTAQLALGTSEIVEETIDDTFTIAFEYASLDKAMRIIKEKNLKILSQKMDLACEISFSIRQKYADEIFNIFNSTFGITIQKKV